MPRGRGCLVVPSAASSSGSMTAPRPRSATKRQPIASASAASRASLGRGASPDPGSLTSGRFGQAMAASTTSPFSMSARATAYCSLRRNPFVPSTGSSVHHRRPGPPGSSQRSSARRRSTSVTSGRCSRTRARTASASSGEAASGPKSSSPMRPSAGRVSVSARLTSACAPRSATVTGEVSALAAAWDGSKSRRTARVSRLAATTAEMAKRRSAPRGLMVGPSRASGSRSITAGRLRVTPPRRRRRAHPGRRPAGRGVRAHRVRPQAACA